jgi:hypothetical protein
MASIYSPLRGPRLARSSDTDLYNFALQYAQAHAFGTPTGVVGAGAAPGAAPGFASPARLELGKQSGLDALARRKKLALSLARRTTESSRKRVLNRILAGYGDTIL